MGIFTSPSKAWENEMRVKQALVDAARSQRIAADAEGRATELAGKIKGYQHVQETLVKDILTLQEVSTSNKGNDYPDYANCVEAIASKYCGTADWGCLQTRTTIDLRSSFILGDGLKVTHTTETRAEAERELAFAEAFLAYNGLDAEMAQELVKESEIEGKCAVKLFYEDLAEEPLDDFPGMVSARFISWTSKRYEVIADPQDYLWYKQLKWTPKGTDKGETLEEPQFVYKKFGGRMNDPNDARPVVGNCLTQIDRLDKALRDLRLINNLFASPTPDFMVEDQSTANLLLSQIENINWKIGKAIVHTGQFQLVSPDVSGVTNLISEIELIVKMISGTTGIPIHYYGLLDLLKNRATGDNTRELVMAATTKERSIWTGAFEEMLDKAMAMYNAVSGEGQKTTKLDPSRIKVSIPLITEEQFTHIQNVYIPAAVAGIISNEFVAEQIPGIDLEAEAERREEREQKEAEQAKADLEMMRTRVTEAGETI